MTTITEYLAEQKRLAEAATEGPWAPWLDQDGQAHMNGMLMVGNAAAVIPDGETWIEGVDVNPIAHTYTPEDRAFIAAARSSVPRMIAALEAVTALHRRVSAPWPHSGGTFVCRADNGLWPCPTIRAVEAALGGEGDGD